jgi:hypothetical protein
MTVPTDKKDRAIYHTILSELHRMQGIMLNLQTMDNADTAAALREHFMRDQNLVLGRLNEWRGRRPEVFRQANEDFKQQVASDSSNAI